MEFYQGLHWFIILHIFGAPTLEFHGCHDQNFYASEQLLWFGKILNWDTMAVPTPNAAVNGQVMHIRCIIFTPVYPFKKKKKKSPQFKRTILHQLYFLQGSQIVEYSYLSTIRCPSTLISGRKWRAWKATLHLSLWYSSMLGGKMDCKNRSIW